MLAASRASAACFRAKDRAVQLAFIGVLLLGFGRGFGRGNWSPEIEGEGGEAFSEGTIFSAQFKWEAKRNASFFGGASRKRHTRASPYRFSFSPI